MRKGLSSIFFILCLLFAGYVAEAQSARTPFGKNRIQYKNLNWRYLSSDNFEVYFYDGGDELAKNAIEYLESEFERLTDVLDYPTYSKTLVFLYNNIADLQQSNSGIGGNRFDIGGQTNFIKSQVEIAYTGSQYEFKQELLHKVSDMLLNDMMFGGSLSEMFQNSYLLTLPDWFIPGAALYLAEGWSIEMDDFMRDLIVHENPNKVKRLSRYEGQDAARIGQSIWNFLAEKYGKSTISNVLNLTRIIRNEEKSIASTLGIPYKQILDDWYFFYAKMANEVMDNYHFPEKEHLLDQNKRKRLIYTTVKYDPTSSYLAYAENNRGRYHVIVENLVTGNRKVVYKTGFKVINQQTDVELPLIDWVDERTLAIISVRKGIYEFIQIDVGNKSKLRRGLDKFTHIENMTINDNGRLAVVSATVGGRSDLYLLSVKRASVRRLTFDIYDDVDPSFIPGTNAVVFASNRTNDTLARHDEKIESLTENFNLFIYNLDTTQKVLTRVTNTISTDLQPLAINPYEYVYLSDQKGIWNLFKYDLRTKVYSQLTDFALSVNQFDVFADSSRMSVVTNYQMNPALYRGISFDPDINQFTQQTERQNIMQARYIATLRMKRRQEELQMEKQVTGDSLRSKKEEELPTPPTEPKEYIDTDYYVFEFEKQQAAGQKPSEKEIDEGFIDTEDYTFETDVVKTPERQETESFLSRYRKFQRKSRIEGPLDYKTRFTADNIVTSFVVDPLRGFGFLLETQMNDLLENHRFIGGIYTSTNLRNGDIYGEYQFLKYKVDFTGRYDRRSYFFDSEIAHKYQINKFELGISYPLNVTTRISVKPFYAYTNFYNLDENVVSPSSQNFPSQSFDNYVGATASLVYDNTTQAGLNIIQGTRGRLDYTQWDNINGGANSFGKLTLDVRNYQKVSREIVLATRVFYGKFFNADKERFILGGMDNWLFYKTSNPDNGFNPLQFNRGRDNSHILFSDFVTSLRGFNYNKLNGTDVLLLNLELRLPVIRYFYRGPISSNFFRNLQFIGFYDIGSAWTGVSPFERNNSVNTEIIKGSESNPFSAEVNTFKNPWMSSYGFGMRTVILGYYMKADLAWPIEDFVTGKPRFYFTLGLDF